MSDGRKRKSGAEYKKLRQKNEQKQEELMKKIPKMQSFFAAKTIPESDSATGRRELKPYYCVHE